MSLTQPVVSADSLLGVHMKMNGAKHSKLKELFFPERGDVDGGEEAVPASAGLPFSGLHTF